MDRLLDSPAYGERWARHWMDIARFGESFGFEQDYDRPYAHHYRDFLIKALNGDMPYDRFVRWQIAGDELATGNPLALMATGFLASAAFPTEITEAEFERSRYEEIDDMIGTMGTAMLGLTVGCARCHDHKYDPIPSSDYYSVAAVFGRTVRTEVQHEPEPGAYDDARSAWEARREELRAGRRAREEDLAGDAFKEWLRDGSQPASTDAWRVVDASAATAESGARIDTLDDGSLLVTGAISDFDKHTITADVMTDGVRAIRLEVLTHPALPNRGPGRSRDGQFHLGRIDAEARPLDDPEAEAVKIRFSAARATDELDADSASAQAAINSDTRTTGWSIRRESLGTSQAAAFELAEPLELHGGARLTFSLHFGYNVHFTVGRYRLSVSRDPAPPLEVGTGVPEALAEGLATLRESRQAPLAGDHAAALLRLYARTDRLWQELDQALAEHELRVPVPTATKILAAAEGLPPARHNATNRGFPHFYEPTYLIRRGDVSQKVAPAKPGFLRALMRATGASSPWRESPPDGWDRSTLDRASLANWIVDHRRGAGALLARVISNRLWHHHFGRGIVATPSDFGSRGDPPSHPELLEWLAQDLVDNGWSLKRLQRLVMTSAAYAQGAGHRSAAAYVDPDNRLLWRWAPRRLEGEAVRDSLLSVSGRLDRRMYGPGTLREDMRRRSVYFFVKRTALVPTMMLLDWPEHLVGIGRRPSTTIAPQALMFLNSPRARGYAEGLAGRLPSAADAQAAVAKAYRLAFNRDPGPGEADEGVAFLRAQTALRESSGERDAARLALVDYCQALLSLNEFLYIR